MKTIIYALLAIIITGMVATAFSKDPDRKNTIMITTFDSQATPGDISRSAEILSARLKDFGAEGFSVTGMPSKNQIRVTLPAAGDLNVLRNLLVQKGEMMITPVYSRRELSILLKGNDSLFLVLPSGPGNDSTSVIGCSSVSDTGNINRTISEQVHLRNCAFAWGLGADPLVSCLYGIKTGDHEHPALTGEDIEQVRSVEDKSSCKYEIEVRFKPTISERWREMTAQNVNHAIAIVLDHHVISAPVVKDEISGGICRITGNFTVIQANFLAAVLNNGRLPVPLGIIK